MTTRDDDLPAVSALTTLVAAGVLSAWTLVAADSCVRSGFAYISLARHFAAALALYAAVGALLGVLAWVLTSLEWRALGRRLEARGGKLPLLRPALYGALAGVASSSTAHWAFRGARVARSSAASWGPLAFSLAVGLFSALGVSLVLSAERALKAGQTARFWRLELLLGSVGLAVVYVDLCTYVALYARIHTLLELSAALTLGATFALALRRGARRSQAAARATRGFAALAGLWLACGVSAPPVRAWLDGALTPVWLDEVYIGRVLRRVQIAEAFFKDPLHWPGLAMSRVDRVRDRYPLGDTTLGAEWSAPLSEPPELAQQISALRGARRGYNLIVYYVDTLRLDVASDPRTMPNLARFSAQGLAFSNAYAAGSDTLRSLPAITGGNYDVSSTPANDLLRLAERTHYRSELVIPASALGFLGKLRPDFRFQHTTSVLDHQPGLEVWGYGATQPTAARLVDEGARFLGAQRADGPPFLLWLFNFDQHNWRELDGDYVAKSAAAHGIAPGGDALRGRYRAVAAGVDDAFGRLLREVDRLGLSERTIIAFVSDHGESLGRNGFWMHSVFLWEDLVRVPFALRVPGLAPARVQSRVSLIDLAPTLARYMDPAPSLEGYQGEDLLGYVAAAGHARRLPILFTAAAKDVLVRIGLVEPNGAFKLVLPFEAALPELFDLGSAHAELVNTAGAHPEKTVELLHQLARSPVFPRSADDFDVRETKQQKAQPHAPEPD